MPTYYSREMRAVADNPRNIPGNEALGGRLRLFRATIALDAPDLTSTTAGASITASDPVVLARVPAGYRFSHGRTTTSVSLGTSTIAIGIAGATGKYRAAAVFTATDTPTNFGAAAAIAAGPLAADEEIIMTTAVATLPTTAGGRLIVDLYFVGP
jgi:hypothetical protein